MIPVHVVQCIALLRAAFPRWYKEMEPESVQILGALLSDVMPADLQRATLHHIATSKWPPSIAELIELASNEREISASVAWETLFKDYDTPMTEAQSRAVEICGGYDAMEEIASRSEYGPPANRKRYTARDESMLFKRFCDAYNAVVGEITHAKGRERSVALAAKLGGTLELTK